MKLHPSKRCLYREDRVSVNVKDEKTFRVLNRGVLQLSRCLLLLVFFLAGAYQLFGGKNKGLGILLLLLGLWLLLDNPLEYFEIIEGLCPACGHKVKSRRRIKFRCARCRRTVIAGSDGFLKECEEAVSLAEPRVLEEVTEEDSQIDYVVMSPGDTLDLHTFSAKEVPSLLDEFMDLSQKADIRLVKIIHGRGTGMLRRRVRKLLARDPRVVAFYDAPPKSGGWGATLVELRWARNNNNDGPST